MTIYDTVKNCRHCQRPTVVYLCIGYSDSGFYCTSCERKEGA